MGCLGVHFALTPDEEKRLRAAKGDASVMAIVEEIESRWEKDHLAQSDKAWDAMHRCFSDGTLNPAGGSPPLPWAVLGGTWLHEGDDYIACLLSPGQVQEISKSMTPLTEVWLRERYFKLDADDYGMDLSEEDFQYTWEYVQCVRSFFEKAARDGRASLFTADQ